MSRKNIEDVIKGMAMLDFYVGVILIVVGLVQMALIGILGSLPLLIGGIACFPSAFLLWGFGELVGNSIRIDRKLAAFLRDME